MEDIDRLIQQIDDTTEAAPVFQDEDEDSGSGSKSVPDNLLHTDLETGLALVDVQRRHREYGDNELSERKEPNFFKKIIIYFIGPVQYVMIAAAILAAGLQHWIELGVIFALLCLNAAVGYIQEYKAGSVVDELRKTVATKTNVLRDRVVCEIPASQIVPGDIIPLEEGCIIPADGKIIDDGFIQVDQSPLTGESLAVEKHKGDQVFSSSVVKRGEATMIVTSIGDNTYVGMTTALVAEADTEGHFKKVLTSIATILLVLVVICVTIVWISGFFRGLSMGILLLHTLVITVIGVPVGLPAVVTTTMAVGAAELARKKVIVQKLAAIESLAGVDILCSDKTGTLTQNKLTMGQPYVVKGATIEDLLATSVLASSRKLKGLDPIDRTVILSLKQHPEVKSTIQHYRTTQFSPFDPVGKKVTATVEDEQGNEMICVKGAPMAVMNMIANDGGIDREIVDDYNSKVEEFASRGFRSLGVARKFNGVWQLLGILQLFDPPRYDTAKTIEEAKDLGLQIKMLTGDAVSIARETCRQLNLGDNVFSIEKLLHPDPSLPKLTGSQFNDIVENCDGFASVFPRDKYMVVDILQKRGHLVAMTGDGMNDAPSLKKADTGIAVEGASDAARAAADIVFLNAGLSTIIDALKTSRMIFHRMRAYVVYRIALSLHLEIFLVTTIVILNVTVNSELVVFLAIFADIATLAIAYDNATFSMRPTKWQLSRLWGVSIFLGVFLAIGTWIIYATTLLGNGRGLASGYGQVQEVLFLEISLTQNWLIFITRSDGPFWSSLPSWELTCAVLAVDVVATAFALVGWFGSPLSIVTVVKIWIFSLGIFVGMALIHGWLSNSTFFDNLFDRSQNSHKYEDLMYNLGRYAILQEKAQKNKENDHSQNEKGIQLGRLREPEYSRLSTLNKNSNGNGNGHGHGMNGTGIRLNGGMGSSSIGNGAGGAYGNGNVRNI